MKFGLAHLAAGAAIGALGADAMPNADKTPKYVQSGKLQSEINKKGSVLCGRGRW
jgi:hypothetical protein